MKQAFNFIFIFFIGHLSFSQTQNYGEAGFSKPMQLPFNLAGSFGEPRPDHFHSGIDIKTNGIEGEPVFSIYDGYISRIRVSPYGYGKAIYITHPNGFTSVYGHLSRFNAIVERYVHLQHYQNKRSELDLVLDAAVFPVKQNDTIAFSGNTGGSTAPHLHFEIRDSKTEFALNPLDFYPKDFYVDTIPPKLNKIKIYKFDSDFYYANTAIYALKKVNGFYTTEDPIAIDDNTRFCFSLEGFDKQDTSENKNGIYKIEVKNKNEIVFQYIMDKIDFNKTRMCNAFVDYDEMMKDRGYFYNCYQLRNNTFPIYTSEKGFFRIDDKDTVELEINCYDINENKTALRFKFIRNDIEPAIDSSVNSDIFSLMVLSDSSSGIQNGNFKISFPKYCFYEDLYINTEKRINTNKEIQSDYYIVYFPDKIIPFQKSAIIELKSMLKKYRSKTVIVKQDPKGKETALKTSFDKRTFYTETRELGIFYLKYDTTKPFIKLLNFNSKDSTFTNQKIHVQITDNLSGIDVYNGYIDDHWINFYLDSKNDLLEYNFDEYCKTGEHNLKIIVTDNKGNKNIVTQKFNYK